MNSRTFIPLIMAIDRDWQYDKIAAELHELLQHHFNIPYKQDALLKDASMLPYPHMGVYIMRSNHIFHDQLPPAGVASAATAPLLRT